MPTHVDVLCRGIESAKHLVAAISQEAGLVVERQQVQSLMLPVVSGNCVAYCTLVPPDESRPQLLVDLVVNITGAHQASSRWLLSFVVQ